MREFKRLRASYPGRPAYNVVVAGEMGTQSGLSTLKIDHASQEPPNEKQSFGSTALCESSAVWQQEDRSLNPSVSQNSSDHPHLTSPIKGEGFPDFPMRQLPQEGGISAFPMQRVRVGRRAPQPWHLARHGARWIRIASTMVAAVVFALSPVAALGDSRDLSMRMEPTFAEMKSVESGIEPVTVTLSNQGRDASGVLTVTSGGYTMAYPIELPSGSAKRLMAYVACSAYMGRARFQLDTDQGSVSRDWMVEPGNNLQLKPLLLVGDAEGALSFMRVGSPAGDPSDEQNRFPRDVYGRPGELPDRAVGYSCLGAVILGEGAERLRDAEVRALQTWVIAGGSLVMIGGASSPVISDPRWSSFVPVGGARPAMVPAPQNLRSFGNEAPTTGSVAVMRGVPVAGCSVEAEHGVPFMVTRPIGMGKVVFMAFNPLEAPLDKWAGRAKLFSSFARGGSGTTAFDEIMQSPYMAGRGGGPGFVSRGPGPGAPGSPIPSRMTQDDPFSVKLPPVASVVWILVGYLVLVVPINLVVLRRLNRSSWAWVTTPVISLGFAAIFFQYAGGLYSAELSVSNTGILVMDTRFDKGYYAGQSQLFFPRGGSYDLRFHDVEAVLPTEQVDYGYGGRDDTGSMDFLNAVDVGKIVVDHMTTSNLSFHQFSFAETVTTAKWLEARITLNASRRGSGPDSLFASGTITNRSPYQISGTLSDGPDVAHLPLLEPGATVKLDRAEFAPRGRPQGVEGPQTWAEGSRFPRLAGSFQNLTLEGSIEGFRPGPQIGKEAPGNRNVKLFAALGGFSVKGGR